MENSYTVGNKTLHIVLDESPQNPRTAFDGQISKMIFFHKRYNLGDKHEIDSNDFGSFADMKSFLIRKLKARVILPVYMYDHSGLVFSTTPFSCPWDSGMIGYMVATKETIESCMNWKVVSKKRKEKIEAQMKGELETYNDYVSGNVYGFQLIDDTTGEEIDSCYGFYGSDHKTNGILDHVGKEFEGVL